MEIFCNNFLACVIGKNEWKDMIKIKTVKEIATVMDEAFTLLILENIWDEWIEMDAVDYLKHQKGIEKGTEQNSKRRKIGGGKWTSDVNGSVKYSGWNDEGLQRFNELCEMVNENRAKFPEFNRSYLIKNTKNSENTVCKQPAAKRTFKIYDDLV